MALGSCVDGVVGVRPCSLPRGIIPGVQSAGHSTEHRPQPGVPGVQLLQANPHLLKHQLWLLLEIIHSLCCSGSLQTILILSQCFNCVWELVNKVQALSVTSGFLISAQRSLSLGGGIPMSTSLALLTVLGVFQASCCSVLLWQELPSPSWLGEGAGIWWRGAAPSSVGDPCRAVGKGSVWCGQSTFIWPQSPAPH